MSKDKAVMSMEETPEATAVQPDDTEMQTQSPRKQRLWPGSIAMEEQPADLAEEWLIQLEKGLFSYPLILDHHFRINVPLLYAPREDCNCLQLKCDEEQERIKIFEPLERFLSNNEDWDTYVQKLVELDRPEPFCGKVFAMGDPTYACRDCGLDPTCVLCVDCFKVSTHRTHRYKIANSSGGGYCDCGDSEAWKNNAHCETHVARLTKTTAKSLPEEDKSRARHLFDVLIPYCFDRLVEPFRLQLPDNLVIPTAELIANGMKDLDSVYCTILYNDESHTFEHVIQTLTRALGCSKKDAIEFASYIDREGRSILKCSNFADCSKVGDLIDRQSTRNGGNPLVVSVAPSLTVCHELFAIRLLNWIQKVVALSPSYREAFYDVLIMSRDVKSSVSILEGVMLSDTGLWKAARSVWHHLFATGLMKDYKTKKKFAAMFTKHYVEIMKDFISDDHEHAYSITSLSVQIFTVPTIARYLIDKGDAFYAVLRSFTSECERRRNTAGKLEFERGATSGPFRRTTFATLDMKYLLSTLPKPEDWQSESFKRHFLHGFGELVKLLSWMQEMDASIRQTGAHMEYEAEWETAFNIFIKVAPVVSLVVDWCATKKSILIRAYRSVLTEIHRTYAGELTSEKTVTREYANHTAVCYVYDISTQPASIHAPLTRLWAALHLRLKEYNLDYSSSEFAVPDKPTPEFLIEPALRGQTFSAQVSANLWKRNGYSILNQLFFYRNVRCRSDMFDKDILSLQIGASTMESNVFLIHALNRFNILNFVFESLDGHTAAKQNPKDFESLKKVVLNHLQNLSETEELRQNGALVEEFLGLVINIVAGRYCPGVGVVTEKECIKKEVIQLLCIKPMTHSLLNKSMVENVHYETGVEEVIGEVATAKKQPGGLVYELKEELYSEFDMFFYHYTREQMSGAENRLVFLRQAKNEPEFFPPPALPPFEEPFKNIVNILNSDVLLRILEIVLDRCKYGYVTCTEAQVRRVLHLMCYAMDEEVAQRNSGIENPFKFCENADRWGVFSMLEQCARKKELGMYHPYMFHVLNRRSLIMSNTPFTDESVPLEVSPRADEEEKARRKKLAAEAREKLMAKMNAAQTEFRTVNADLFLQEELPNVSASNANIETNTVALGPDQSRRPTGNESYTCILCQETQPLTEAAGFTLPVFIQRSTVHCQNREKLKKAWKGKRDNEHMWRRTPLFIHPDLRCAPHLNCCGHPMHSVCWQRHFETVLLKERRRPYRNSMTFDVEKNEFLCPMCQCLCNAVMPMVAPSNDYFEPLEYPPRTDGFELDISVPLEPTYLDWAKMCLIICFSASPLTFDYMPTDEAYKAYCISSPECEIVRGLSNPNVNMWNVSTLEDIFEKVSPEIRNTFLFFFPKGGRGLLRDDMMEITTLYIHSIFTKGLGGKAGSDGEFRFPAMTWQAIAFTIINSEILHRDQELPFFGEGVPVRQAAAMNYSVLSGCLVSVYCQLYDTPTLLSTALIRLAAIMMNGNSHPNILKIDAFSALVSLTYSMPALFLDKHHRRPLLMGNLQEFYILRTVTILHMVQVVLVNELERFTIKEGEAANNAEDLASPLVKACVKIWRDYGKYFMPHHEDLNWKLIRVEITKSMIPYLRCCCKFYECLTGIQTPKNLETVENRFEDLVKYLGLSANLDDYCNDYLAVDEIENDLALTYAHKSEYAGSQPRFRKVAQGFAHYNFDSPTPSPSWRNFTYPRKFPKLIDLPEDYAELLNSTSDFSCRSCDHECRIPTLCLICGEILCSQSYCCQMDFKGTMVGACTYHSYYCGGSVGIFLRIRECKVFFLAGRGKGCFMPPPYLDEYGETDQGLRRGNPLKLCKEKYEEFRRSWMYHKIHDDIASNTEQIPSLVATEWQFL